MAQKKGRENYFAGAGGTPVVLRMGKDAPGPGRISLLPIVSHCS